MTTINGTPVDDVLTGTSDQDFIYGGAGADTLYGGDGADVLEGGTGSNQLFGGAGSDTASFIHVAGATIDLNTGLAQGADQTTTLSGIENVWGSDHDDVIYGDAGNNLIEPLAGTNLVYGGGGNDYFPIGFGSDTIDGGAGFDSASFSGMTAPVTAYLDPSRTGSVGTNPAIIGVDYNGGTVVLRNIESLEGGSGNDHLFGDNGNNYLYGDAGDDVLDPGGNTGVAPQNVETLDGGAGIDTVTFASAGSGVQVDLRVGSSGPTVQDVGTGYYYLIGIENLIGTAYDDVLTGMGNSVLEGGAGNDTLNGISTNDYVSYASAGSGVTVDLRLTTAQNTGGAGIDTLNGGILNAIGSAFDDVLIGDSRNTILDGGGGADMLFGGGGSGVDQVSYASATAGVTVSLAVAGPQNTIGAGVDTLVGFQWLTGSAFNDILTGDSGGNHLFGAAGADTLSGGLGSNILDGGDGTDIVSYAANGAAVIIDLSSGGASGAGWSDSYTSIEGLTGSAFDDTLTGNAGNNQLNGGAGDDTIYGGDGGDQISGGSGNNQLYGGASGNTFFSGLGVDTIFGGGTSNTVNFTVATAGVVASLLTGQAATSAGTIATFTEITGLVGSDFNDILTGNDANNSLSGGLGDDVLYGGAGNDNFSTGGGGDTIYGGAGDDVVQGVVAGIGLVLGGHSAFYGGDGSDQLALINAVNALHLDLGSSAAQADGAGGTLVLSSVETLLGGNGDDVIVGSSANETVGGGLLGNDRLDGGGGVDTVSYGITSGASVGLAGVAVDLRITSAQDTGIGGMDTLVNFENVTGSSANDRLTGTDGVNQLSGGSGDDVLTGLGGDDVLNGGSLLAGSGTDNDTLDGGSGNDTATYASATAGVTVSLMISTFQDTVGSGVDTLISIENLIGSKFNDTLTGDGGANTIDGGAGNDVLNGGAGLDTVSYASATLGVNVSLALTTAQNTIGAGTDTLSGFEALIGSAFNDTLIGDGGANTIDGGAGNDSLDGGLGSDTVSYASASSAVTVSLAVTGAQNTIGAGTDTLASFENLGGSAFDDRLTGDASDNIISGMAGDDFLYGGAGNDTLDGGAGTDIASYASATAAATVSLAVTTAQDTHGAGTDTLISIENLSGSAFNDTLTGDSGANVISGVAGDDTINGGAGVDTLTGGAGNDVLDGGADVDTAVFSGAMSAYIITKTADGVTVTGPDGTDTLTNVEFLRFSDQTYHFEPGTATAVDFTAAPSTYAAALRDFDGNDLGSGGSWVLAGHVDIQGDGDQEYVLFNRDIGRWATIGPAADGKVYFDDHSWAGDTRVVGIYIDPEVQLGHAIQGGPDDSQRRFQNDLDIGNIKGILGAGDFNHDGLQEVYFALTDGTAYLHAYMHADGNIEYANYQSQAQVTDYLTANGFNSATWSGWFV